MILTGNARIDAAWLWAESETVDRVHFTFKNALQLIPAYMCDDVANSPALDRGAFTRHNLVIGAYRQILQSSGIELPSTWKERLESLCADLSRVSTFGEKAQESQAVRQVA
jgi:hypothetical protein